ncbi:MAG: hypothetical protein AAF960_13250 [Bacteroidota bacterium]
MRPLMFLFCLIICFSCETTTSTQTSLDQSQLSNSLPKNAEQTDLAVSPPKKCAVAGEMLEENELWLKDQQKMVCILADSSTYDPQLGMSHRILEVIDTRSCDVSLRLTLPVNISPDFPYYLADINYNNDSKIVAIKAAKQVYCLDVATEKMLPLLTPQFKTERPLADPNSGTIIRLELWEDFLVGYAQDQGTFVFNLQKQGTQAAVLPFAEHRVNENEFSSLFLLPSSDGKVQAILPDFDWEEEQFVINPVFQQPTTLSTNVQESALDNRFLVLREANDSPVLIDMLARKRIVVPTALASESTKTILDWVKKNG